MRSRVGNSTRTPTASRIRGEGRRNGARRGESEGGGSAAYMVMLCVIFGLVVLLLVVVFEPGVAPTPPSIPLLDGRRGDALGKASNLRLPSLLRRRGKHRIAIIIPFMKTKGTSASLPPYFEAFATSAAGSASLVDFLIFHDGLPAHVIPQGLPPNVLLIDLKSTEAMIELMVTKVLEERIDNLVMSLDHKLLPGMSKLLSNMPYILVEFKPAMGHIFQDYLKGYSHWGYSDLDIVFGDLPRWITEEELTDYDIVTYGFGDQERVYLRGQFTFHKNVDPVNQVWRGCDYLSKMDERFQHVWTHPKERMRLESAEGCYSYAVLSRNDLMVKYVVKAFTDVDEDSDPAFRHGLFIGRGKNRDRTVVYKAGTAAGDGQRTLELSSSWFEDHELSQHPYTDPSKPPLQWEIEGTLEKVVTHKEKYGDSKEANCMFWAPKTYQPEICAVNVDKADTVFLKHGVLYKQRQKRIQFPSDIITFPFFHFQEWKRYYRPNQMAPMKHTSTVPGWILTKEGAIPLLPATSTPSTSALPRNEALMEIHDRVSDWLVSTDDNGNTKELPPSLYCMRSSQKRAPPPSAHCDKFVSWADQSNVVLLTDAVDWDKKVKMNADVTLALTVQMTMGEDEENASKDLDWLRRLLITAESNVRAWAGQPSVLVIHVGGVTPEGREMMQERFSPDPVNKPYLRSCLVAAVYSTNKAEVSRKALLNMASDAAPTRWVVTGLEVERGLIMSAEASMFAKRAAKTYGSTSTGGVFYIPQFAALNTFGAADMDAPKGLFHPPSVMIFLRNALMTKKEGSTYINYVETTSNLQSLDCDPCDRPKEGKEEEDAIIKSINNLWLDVSKFEVWPGVSEDASKEWTEVTGTPKKLADRMEKIQVTLMNLLSQEEAFVLHHFDLSPILMVDALGPRKGMITADIASEVQEFGGRRCYNGLRLAQLATLGYQINVLGGAFAVSLPTSRSASCPNHRHLESSEKKPTAQGGKPNDAKQGGFVDPAINTRCRGCFMLSNEKLLFSILKDERIRPVKSAVLWDDLGRIHGA